MTEKDFEIYKSGEHTEEGKIEPEILAEGQEYEIEPEKDEANQWETKPKKERRVLADDTIKETLERAMDEIDPEREAALVFIEYVDSEARNRSDARGLDFVKELAETESKVIITGWCRESDYARDPRWHLAMAYPNVEFVRLPFSLKSMKEIMAQFEGERRPFDQLAIRLAGIKRDMNKVGTLEHNLHHAINGGPEAMEAWEKQARAIFGEELSLDEVIERIKKKDPTSLEGELAGEEFADLCVDVEDTLVQDGVINAELVERMKVASKERPITIWTGGDMKQIEKLLRDAGISFKLASKHWLRGAKVAKAIDNMPQAEFLETYGIEAGEYEQIESK